ncbi:MAG TPA: hypothetical protein VNL94_09110 [Candidatus Binatia bacterium]|nr:hypothetical protein [Candidatus Binatia bacterium]
MLAASTIAIVAACQSPAATTTPTTPSATGGQPTAGSSTSPTEAPSTGLGGLFHLVGSEPVIPRTTFEDRGAVLPGAIVVDADGTYHAWVVAFGEPAGTQEIHYLTSTDAVAWTETPDDSLAGLSEGFGNPGAFPTSVLETEDGWVMYLVGTLASEQAGWDIWRATAPAPSGPWARSDAPVLTRGGEGSWDAGGLDFPSVIPTDDGFAMFYSGIPSSETNEGAIGMATSADGIAWTKVEAPVAEPGLCGEFDARAVLQPSVLPGPNGLYLIYAGHAGDDASRPGVGFATSTDNGATWACQWPANALNVSEFPNGDGVHTATAFLRGERVALLVEWLSDNGSDVWLAHLGPRQE